MFSLATGIHKISYLCNKIALREQTAKFYLDGPIQKGANTVPFS